MALNLTPLTTAIEELLEGTIGTTRTVTANTFKKGAHAGRQSGAQQALTLVNTRYEVRFSSGRQHEASAISHNASSRLEELDIEVVLRYTFSAEVLEDKRSTVVNSIHNDRDIALQALLYPGNLLETQASVATNLVSGMLMGPYSFDLDEDWENKMAVLTLSLRGVVNISQAVS